MAAEFHRAHADHEVGAAAGGQGLIDLHETAARTDVGDRAPHADAMRTRRTDLDTARTSVPFFRTLVARRFLGWARCLIGIDRALAGEFDGPDLGFALH